MNILSLLSSVEAPSSLWVTLINWIKSGVGNLGWTIILVTVLVKLVTTPLEFWVKYNTKKQTLVQQKCAPQVAKLQKKFGNDRQTLQVQTQSLYKREGLDMRTGCIVMLLNMILSFTIFITFYNDLRKVSAYEAINQYEQIEASYDETFAQRFADYSSEDDIDTVQKAKDWKANYDKLSAEEQKTAKAQYEAAYNYANGYASADAKKTWSEIKKTSSWLWIQNIWVADSTTRAFPSYDTLVSMCSGDNKTYVEENINSTKYDSLATIVVEDADRTNNGYYVLPVLAGLITFLSQYISDLHNKLKNKKANKLAKSANDQMGASMKIMKFVMPVIMIIFTLTTSASFGLYILASNISSITLGELTTLIINALTKKKRLEVEEELEKEANRLIKKGKLEV